MNLVVLGKIFIRCYRLHPSYEAVYVSDYSEMAFYPFSFLA